MSKVAVALGSFIVGACSAFFALPGSHTSILAQAPPPTRPPASKLRLIVDEHAFPGVRPISMILTDIPFSETTQQLDGVDCVRCTFNDVTLEYGGGSYKFTESRFSGPIRVEFKGAAANTLALLQVLQSLAAGSQPKPPTPKAPIKRAATPKKPVKVTLLSPYQGQ